VEPLAIFDVDGTLCDTSDVDDECFCETASEILGIPVPARTWEGSPHITDSGIVEWLWMRHRGRSATDGEVSTFIDRFRAKLGRELDRDLGRFRSVKGAGPFLVELLERGWNVAFATGGWGETARLKLRAAGLPVERLLASSDDSRDRAEIFRLASARAVQLSTPLPDRTVLFGDGVWDIRVASQIGWRFVGVGSGPRGDLLRRSGARVVIPDFANPASNTAALADCEVPPWCAPGDGAP
jgi:phosphoglycolate phosphatase-like HAD superfamily hydrolase